MRLTAAARALTNTTEGLMIAAVDEDDGSARASALRELNEFEEEPSETWTHTDARERAMQRKKMQTARQQILKDALADADSGAADAGAADDGKECSSGLLLCGASSWSAPTGVPHGDQRGPRAFSALPRLRQ